MNVVVDASVGVKWFVRTERDAEAALSILRQRAAGEALIFAPMHFVAEVAAVLLREAPEIATQAITAIDAIGVRIRTELPIMTHAVSLAIELEHHLFDTLYHACAFAVDDAVLVTADERYYDKARHLGRIRLLSNWPH